MACLSSIGGMNGVWDAYVPEIYGTPRLQTPPTLSIYTISGETILVGASPVLGEACPKVLGVELGNSLSWMQLRRCQIEVSASRLPLVQTQKNYPTVVCVHRVACHARRLIGMRRLWRDQCIITVPELGRKSGVNMGTPIVWILICARCQPSDTNTSHQLHHYQRHQDASFNPLNQAWNLKSVFMSNLMRVTRVTGQQFLHP